MLVIQPALPQRVLNDFTAAMETKFISQPNFVSFDGFDAQPQFIGDFFVAEAPRDTDQDFALAFAQGNCLRRATAGSAAYLPRQRLASQGGFKMQAAFGDRVDGPD